MLAIGRSITMTKPSATYIAANRGIGVFDAKRVAYNKLREHYCDSLSMACQTMSLWQCACQLGGIGCKGYSRMDVL